MEPSFWHYWTINFNETNEVPSQDSFPLVSLYLYCYCTSCCFNFVQIGGQIVIAIGPPHQWDWRSPLLRRNPQEFGLRTTASWEMPPKLPTWARLFQEIREGNIMIGNLLHTSHQFDLWTESSFSVRWGTNYSKVQPLVGYQYLPNLQIHCRINHDSKRPFCCFSPV